MRRGFTLLEVMVALAVLAIIGALTFTTIASVVKASKYLEEDDATDQAARVALGHVRKDLSLAWLTPNVQAVNAFKTIFVAHDEHPDILWFTSLSHQRLYQDARECDQTEITLWTQSDPTVPNAYVLLRREAPRIDQDPERGGSPLPLAYGVKSFEVSLLDPLTNEWKEEWDSTGVDQANRLPRAARVILTLLAPDPDDPDEWIPRSYMTTVVLQYATPLKRTLLNGGTP